MPRKPRNEFAGAVWHVTSRGVNGENIFRYIDDYQRFLELFGGFATHFGWRVYKLTLMTNHTHAIIETPEPNLGKGMKRILERYAQSFNRRYNRTGHLFQGRFGSTLIEKESHLLEAIRYVLLNPVRAGMTRDIRDYRWTSYHLMMSDTPPPWLEVETVLRYFHPTDLVIARKLFLQFVEEGIDKPKPLCLIG